MAGIATEKPDLILMDINLEGDLDGVTGREGERQVPHALHLCDLPRGQGHDPNGEADAPGRLHREAVDENDLRSNIEIALFRYANHLDASTTERTNGDAEEFVIADSVFVKEKGRLVKVPFLEIRYAEAYDNHTKLFTADHRFTVGATIRPAGPPGRAFPACTAAAW